MFSYLLNLEEDKDKVRFSIQDTKELAGPLPGDQNFQDEEIEAIIELEGGWQRAVARCFEVLAAAWRLYPNIESDQFGLSRSHISRGYAEDAKLWREQWGWPTGAASVAGVRVYHPVKVDAYSSTLTIAGVVVA